MKIIFRFLLLFALRSSAQNLSAYTDPRDIFHVFSDSTTHQADYLKPVSFQVGRNCVAFIDNTKSFKIDYKNTVTKINEGFTTDYSVSSNLVFFRSNNSAYVWDNGKTSLLAAVCSRVFAADSFIAFYDDRNFDFNIYYKGQIETLISGSNGDPVGLAEAGDNIFAWTDAYGNFRIWHNGENTDQDNRAPLRISAGKNTIAYISYNNEFKICYKGETYDIEPFASKRFFAADDLVGFVTSAGEFEIFYDGKITDVGFYTPQNLSLRDNMLCWTDEAGLFFVFYKGVITQLENYYPSKVELSENSVLWIDQNDRTNFFSFGKKYQLPADNITSIRLDYDVLQYNLGLNDFHFYYQGKHW